MPAPYLYFNRTELWASWDKTAFAGIVLSNDKWNFAPGDTRVAIPIGGDWISASSDNDWFRATEQKNVLLVPIRHYPVESLLNHANSITLRHHSAELSVPLG